MAALSCFKSVAPAQASHPTLRILPIEFASEKQVFCDWWFIDAGYGLVTGAKQEQTHDGSMSCRAEWSCVPADQNSPNLPYFSRDADRRHHDGRLLHDVAGWRQVSTLV